MTEALRIRLIKALAVPHMNYCSVVYLDCSVKLKDRLQRLNNSCLRYIFGVRRDTRVTLYRERLGWLTTISRRFYFAAIYMYKILRIRQPEYLLDFFDKYIPKSTSRGNS